MRFNLAIDGPAGAGKSTIAKRVAKELSFVYVDTGAMYRAMGIYFSDLGIAPEEQEKIEAACKDVKISISYENGEQQVYLNGVNVTGRLRTEEAGKMASATSAYLEVRKKLVELQQEMAENTDLVMDGRDIGTLRVKTWKNKLPTYYPDLFDPSLHTLPEIAGAMCQAELVHEVIIPLSLLPILASHWFHAFPVFLLTSLAASLFDLLLVITQRYNRDRILRILNHKKSK